MVFSLMHAHQTENTKLSSTFQAKVESLTVNMENTFTFIKGQNNEDPVTPPDLDWQSAES